MSLDSEDRVSLPLRPPDRDKAAQMDRRIRNQRINAARFPRLENNNRSFVPISSRHIICAWCPITERSHQRLAKRVRGATLSFLVSLESRSLYSFQISVRGKHSICQDVIVSDFSWSLSWSAIVYSLRCLVQDVTFSTEKHRRRHLLLLSLSRCDRKGHRRRW